MNFSNAKLKIALLLLFSFSLVACKTNPTEGTSKTLAELIHLEIATAPISGKYCEVMPSAKRSQTDYETRVSQVSECTLSGNIAQFTDSATGMVALFGEQANVAGLGEANLSECKYERAKYLRIVAGDRQFACWDAPYKDVVDLLVSATNPNSEQRDCANLYDIDASYRHRNDWACLKGKTSVFERNYSPIEFQFSTQQCPADQRALPANIVPAAAPRPATFEEKRTLGHAQIINNCSKDATWSIRVPDEFGPLRFDWYRFNTSRTATPSVWTDGQFSAAKYVTFTAVPNPVVNGQPQSRKDGCLWSVVEWGDTNWGKRLFNGPVLDSMWIGSQSPTNESNFCYRAPGNVNFTLENTDTSTARPGTKCMALSGTQRYLCYPAVVEYSQDLSVVTSLSLSNTATNNHSKCTKIQGSGIPAQYVQDICLTETLIDVGYWAPGEPNNPAHDCAVMRPDGYWDDRHCDEIRPFVCENMTDASDIKVTQVEGTWEQGFETCHEIFGNNYQFSNSRKPLPIDQSTLAFSSNSLLSVHAARASDVHPWINYQANQADEFRQIEYGYQNPQLPHPANQTLVAAVSDNQNARWYFWDPEQTYSTGIQNLRPHFFCRSTFKRDGDTGSSSWRITQATGRWEDGFEECKKLEDGSFEFAKPRNETEDRILRTIANTRNSSFTWVNLVRSPDYHWRGNLIASPFHNWLDARKPDNENGKCAQILKDGNWVNKPCSEAKAYSCRSTTNRDNWIVSNAEGPFIEGFDVCRSLGAYEFSSPHSLRDNALLLPRLAAEGAWINFAANRSYLEYYDWGPANRDDFDFLTLAEMKALVSSDSHFGAILKHLSASTESGGLGLPPLVIDIVASAQATQTVYTISYDTEGFPAGLNITVNDQRQPTKEEFWYVLGQIMSEMLLGELPSEQACPGDYPRTLTSAAFDGSESEACRFREAYAQWFTATMVNDHLSGNALASAIDNWQPVGSGRHLSVADIFSCIFRTAGCVHNLGMDDREYTIKISNPKTVHHAVSGCAATYGSDTVTSTCQEHVQDEFFEQEYSQCGIITVGQGQTATANYDSANCNIKLPIACQEVDETTFQPTNTIKLTGGVYPVKDADIACVIDSALNPSPPTADPLKYYVGFVGSANTFATHATTGTGTVGTAGRCAPSDTSCSNNNSNSGRKRKLSSEDMENGINNSKRLKTSATASLTLSNQARAGFNWFELHTIPVGAGSCHLAQCIETFPVTGLIKSIDSVLYDCGSSGKGPNGLSNWGVAWHLFLSGFYLDVSPTVVVSHPDTDHFSYIHRMGLDWLGTTDQIWLGGDAAQRDPQQLALIDYFDNQHRANAAPRGIRGGFKNWVLNRETAIINGKTLNDIAPPIDMDQTERWGNHGTLAKSFAACNEASLETLVVNTPNTAAPANQVGLHRNANSSVVRITMDGNNGQSNFYHAILPGDALGITEDAINHDDYIYSDIFSVNLIASPHHGSSEHRSNTTIKRFYPDYVVVSAGTKYSHPHRFVVDGYKNNQHIAQTTSHCVPRGFGYAAETGVPSPPLAIAPSYDKHTTTAGIYSTLGSGHIISQVKIPHDRTRTAQHQIYASPGTLCN